MWLPNHRASTTERTYPPSTLLSEIVLACTLQSARNAADGERGTLLEAGTGDGDGAAAGVHGAARTDHGDHWSGW